MKEWYMKMPDKSIPTQNTGSSEQNDLRPEYDEALLTELLKKGVRGKYVERYRQGSNVVKLAPNIAAAFSTEQSVNEALRKLLASGNVPA